MSNPNSENFNEICGYLKVSISCIATGDENVQLVEDGGIDKTDEEFILTPPSIKTDYYQVKFRFFKAENLPKMDTFGSIDAYIKTTYLKKKIKTSVVTQKNNELFWDEEIWVFLIINVIDSSSSSHCHRQNCDEDL